jgi:TolB protein
MNRHRLTLLALLLAWFTQVQAQLTIEVTGGVEGAQPIAVVPFGAEQGAMPPLDVGSVIGADLARSGRFKPMPARDMLATPHTPAEVDMRDWRLLGMQHVVVGTISPVGGGFNLDFALLDVFSGDQLLGGTRQTTAAGMRYTAHRIADAIYEKLTGQPGVFSTRIAYVTDQGSGGRVTLRVSDADGFGAQTIVSSNEPILSPAWSPDGQRLAYVSFENRRAAIYVQDLGSGRRELVASHPGINGSPAFSPDGRSLAMTLSKGGNPDIYVLDLGSRELRQITDHFGIDTEPAWSPDGSAIAFTSNRGGGPQIYKASAAGGPAERVTFQNDYNAAAAFSPDGRSLALVTRVDGQFRIALHKLGGGGPMRIMSTGTLDESPSFAPNGSMIIYATQHNGRGVLAAASVDGRVSQRLSQDAGEVREPAWSPQVE